MDASLDMRLANAKASFDMARKCGRLENTLEAVSRKLEITVLPALEGWRKDEVRGLIERIAVDLNPELPAIGAIKS